MDAVNPYETVLRALELGTATSREAHAELRLLIAEFGPGLQEVRRAAVTALACAAGPDATADFAALLSDPTRSVRECAADVLYNVGDGRAWEEVFAYYQDEVRRRGPRRAGLPYAMPLSYLLVQAESGSQGAVRLIGFLRQEWGRLSAFEREWLGGNLPQAAPEGPPPAQVALPTRAHLDRVGASAG
ncbi:hypothetical protein Kisp01_60300 [Kineosporia sp. NBRC 101677]|uniref:HEAT repeat domain-containing protein n=1 Tax=Kineosporia sp. NBRC 101677 TaxID=3032197 RepID=UPI0024A48DA0|nr:HEAT repeat domain-containing protein [Kineosporia sp. NBRC 101677]GLY19016.1 hypothetical protein Kisp01_60300 [Kineosporia sp. NBRC 101677]